MVGDNLSPKARKEKLHPLAIVLSVMHTSEQRKRSYFQVTLYIYFKLTDIYKTLLLVIVLYCFI